MSSSPESPELPEKPDSAGPLGPPAPARPYVAPEESELDRRGVSANGQAMLWVHRITGLSMSMAAPPLAGWWADGRFGTRPWLMLLGVGVGLALMITGLMQLAKSSESGS